MKQRYTKQQWDDLDDDLKVKIFDLKLGDEKHITSNGKLWMQMNIGQMVEYLGEDNTC